MERLQAVVASAKEGVAPEAPPLRHPTGDWRILRARLAPASRGRARGGRRAGAQGHDRDATATAKLAVEPAATAAAAAASLTAAAAPAAAPPVTAAAAPPASTADHEEEEGGGGAGGTRAAAAAAVATATRPGELTVTGVGAAVRKRMEGEKGAGGVLSMPPSPVRTGLPPASSLRVQQQQPMRPPLALAPPPILLVLSWARTLATNQAHLAARLPRLLQPLAPR